MPVYTYRREDGTQFDYKQRFLDEPLETCPTTGQKVVRIIQKPNVIFKGSGFYVNDSKDASKRSANGSGTNGNGSTNDSPTDGSVDSPAANSTANSAETSSSSPAAEASKPASENGSSKKLTPIPTKD